MPAPTDYVRATRRHIDDLYRRLLISEDVAKARRRRTPQPTFEQLMAAAQRRHDHEADQVTPPPPTVRVRSIVDHFEAAGVEHVRTFFERHRKFAEYLLTLSASDLLKERFDTEAIRWNHFACALWWARRSFEWTFERACEGLLRRDRGTREHTLYAAGMATRYELRDGFAPMAFLPRVPAVWAELDSSGRAAYERWSVDYRPRVSDPEED